VPKRRDPYAEDLRRKADHFSALARLVEQRPDTERNRCLAEVVRGLAELCVMLAEAYEEDEEVEELVE
jgi:hypothetical protein